MIKLKVHNQNCKLKIDENTLGIDIVVAICRLYIALMDAGFNKKDIDWQIAECLRGMKKLEKERECEK